MWNRFSNSHHHNNHHNHQQQNHVQHQPTSEVLTVGAAMPVLPHYYSPENEQISPVNSYLQSNPIFTKTYEEKVEISNRFPIRSDSYKRSTQGPPIVPEHRRLNAAESSSSDESSNPPKAPNIQSRPNKAPPPPPTRQTVN